jgi:hypothetical protein
MMLTSSLWDDDSYKPSTPRYERFDRDMFYKKYGKSGE